MKIIADLHLHSRYSQACSKDIDIKNLAKWGKIKGLDLLGTGDFSHPEWKKELYRELIKENHGIYYTDNDMAFLCSTEISLIYSQDGKGRRIHLIVLAPSLEVSDEITKYLLKYGRIDYDGRPIFKIPAWQFVKDVKEINNEIEVIPAHVWTPWFSLFGSKSGFNSIRECFKEHTKEIHAIETGLSSDIEMNDRIKELYGMRKVSFSDSHSYWPWRLGREATIFQVESLTYKNIVSSIRTGKGLWGTIEVEPSYGKYHYDGHRECNISLSPLETKKYKGICPKCKRHLTIGVLNRVEELADNISQKNSQQFYKLIPLHEIIAKVLETSVVSSKQVWNEYWKLLKIGENEFDILLNKDVDELSLATTKDIAEAIIKIREGAYTLIPGYDGVYGEVVLEKKNKNRTKYVVARRNRDLNEFFKS